MENIWKNISEEVLSVLYLSKHLWLYYIFTLGNDCSVEYPDKALQRTENREH